MKRSRVPAALLLGLAAGSSPTVLSAQMPPSVEFRVPKAPTVFASDSGAALVYELHITNLTPTPLTLRRVEVLNERDGSVLHMAEDSLLQRDIARPGSNVPAGERAKIAGGTRAVVFLWVPVSRGDAPASVRQRLTFERGTLDTTLHVLEGAPVGVAREAAAIGPPLRGEWLAANGPSNTSGHRRAAISFNGTVAIGQRFAIDYLQVDQQGRTTRTDRTRNENFYAEGQEALAVADGIVVDTRDSIPENVPGGRAVPITLVTVAGNYIVLDIGNGRFAFYAHLIPGSLRVRVGDRVRRGQVIGLVGNSGNSTEPHLHFHIADGIARGTSTLGAEGIPYAVDNLEIVGRCAMATGISCTRGAPVAVGGGGMPLQNQLVRFPGGPGTAPKPDYSAPAGAPYTSEDLTIPTAMGHTSQPPVRHRPGWLPWQLHQIAATGAGGTLRGGAGRGLAGRAPRELNCRQRTLSVRLQRQAGLCEYSILAPDHDCRDRCGHVSRHWLRRVGSRRADHTNVPRVRGAPKPQPEPITAHAGIEGTAAGTSAVCC